MKQVILPTQSSENVSPDKIYIGVVLSRMTPETNIYILRYELSPKLTETGYIFRSVNNKFGACGWQESSRLAIETFLGFKNSKVYEFSTYLEAFQWIDSQRFIVPLNKEE